jgi:hypothetical protein
MKCMRCGKFLKRDHWGRGYDEQCREVLNQAALQLTREFSENQIRKAAQALREGSCVHVGNGLYRFTSSDGRSVYWTTERDCTCPAGEHDIKCYHRATVRIRNLTSIR